MNSSNVVSALPLVFGFLSARSPVYFLLCLALTLNEAQKIAAEELRSLVKAVESANNLSPLEIQSSPEVMKLKQAVLNTYLVGDTATLTELLRDHPPQSPVGQIVALTLSSSIEFRPNQVDRLASFFMASIDWPDDRLVDLPRGAIAADTYRYKLASHVLAMLEGKGISDDPSFKTMPTSPDIWLESHLSAAKGRLGPEVDLALDRALEIIRRANEKNTQANTAPQGSSSNAAQVPQRPLGSAQADQPTSHYQTSETTPWSIVVVLIVAAGGLLWLLLKRRS